MAEEMNPYAEELERLKSEIERLLEAGWSETNWADGGAGFRANLKDLEELLEAAVLREWDRVRRVMKARSLSGDDVLASKGNFDPKEVHEWFEKEVRRIGLAD